MEAFDSSARIVRACINQVGPFCDSIAKKVEGASIPQVPVQWGEVMERYSRLSKQLDILLSDLKPGAFSMSLVIPNKMTNNDPLLSKCNLLNFRILCRIISLFSSTLLSQFLQS